MKDRVKNESIREMIRRREEKRYLNINDAIVIWSNFEGREQRFNPKGVRNFCVVIDDPDVATRMIEDGWNIKEYAYEGEQPFHYLKVNVRYDKFPPSVCLITKNGEVPLDESRVGELDRLDIERMDVRISPSQWSMNGKTGVSAYLDSARVTLNNGVQKYAMEEAPIEEDDLPF